MGGTVGGTVAVTKVLLNGTKYKFASRLGEKFECRGDGWVKPTLYRPATQFDFVGCVQFLQKIQWEYQCSSLSHAGKPHLKSNFGSFAKNGLSPIPHCNRICAGSQEFMPTPGQIQIRGVIGSLEIFSLLPIEDQGANDRPGDHGIVGYVHKIAHLRRKPS